MSNLEQLSREINKEVNQFKAKLDSTVLAFQAKLDMEARHLHISGREARATHQCKICKAKWIRHDNGMWSLASLEAGQCCDNVAMGDQIEAIGLTAQVEYLSKTNAKLDKKIQELQDQLAQAQKHTPTGYVHKQVYQQLLDEIAAAKKAAGGFCQHPFDGSLVTAINVISLRCAAVERDYKHLQTAIESAAKGLPIWWHEYTGAVGSMRGYCDMLQGQLNAAQDKITFLEAHINAQS